VNVIAEVKQIANNVLYFNDSSDYSSALWEILELVSPETFKDDPEPELSYIEDLKDNSEKI